MRYDSTIRYEDKSVTIKVTNIELSGHFQLPDFLKALRVSRGHTFRDVHLRTDFTEEFCQEYEEGKRKIPKKYLSWICSAYNIPRKPMILGIVPKQDIKKTIGIKIKELRTAEGISQVMFASTIGVARATLAGYEIGKSEPDIMTLIKIADFFRVSLDYLTGRMNNSSSLDFW